MKYSTRKSVTSDKVPKPRLGLPQMNDVYRVPLDTKLINEVLDFVGDKEYLRYLARAVKVPMRGWRMASRDAKIFNLQIKVTSALSYDVRLDRDKNILKIKAVDHGT